MSFSLCAVYKNARDKTLEIISLFTLCQLLLKLFSSENVCNKEDRVYVGVSVNRLIRSGCCSLYWPWFDHRILEEPSSSQEYSPDRNDRHAPCYPDWLHDSRQRCPIAFDRDHSEFDGNLSRPEYSPWQNIDHAWMICARETNPWVEEETRGTDLIFGTSLSVSTRWYSAGFCIVTQGNSGRCVEPCVRSIDSSSFIVLMTMNMLEVQESCWLDSETKRRCLLITEKHTIVTIRKVNGSTQRQRSAQASMVLVRW